MHSRRFGGSLLTSINLVGTNEIQCLRYFDFALVVFVGSSIPLVEAFGGSFQSDLVGFWWTFDGAFQWIW